MAGVSGRLFDKFNMHFFIRIHFMSFIVFIYDFGLVLMTRRISMIYCFWGFRLQENHMRYVVK